MTYTSEFIVEPVDTSDDAWRFLKNIQDSDSRKILNLGGGIDKKFTSLATNATIFRWRFGDKPNNPIVETTINPYIHTYKKSGTYLVSHQSCYPCVPTGELACSNGWCTQSIEIVVPKGGDILLTSAGILGLFIIAKREDCCELRRKCGQVKKVCRTVKPEDIKNTEKCKSLEESCRIKLRDCRIKCIHTGYEWKKSYSQCYDKKDPKKEICQTIPLHKQRYKFRENNQ